MVQLCGKQAFKILKIVYLNKSFIYETYLSTVNFLIFKHHTNIYFNNNSLPNDKQLIVLTK